jgi:predicted ATPase/DNA-binding CsgD family transcriptional regulator
MIVMKEKARSKEQGQFDALNGRELEILGMLAKGLSNNEISRKLHLSLDTIKWYNKQLFSKLEVSSRTQAVVKAVETGLLETAAGTLATNELVAIPLAKKDIRPVHHLPVPITSFIGREQEIQEVQHLVTGNRLVTITGAGGVGKTRLAIQVASTFVPQFPNGVRWAGLAGLFEVTGGTTADGTLSSTASRIGEELVTQAVAKAFRVPESADLPLIQTLIEHLGDKQVLIVLDNCEHLIQACASATEQLLAGCPRLSILATSREGLGVPGEKVWRLPSLSTTVEARRADHELPTYPEAVILFFVRAADAVPGYQPGDTDPQIIAQICKRLDGIPLAIELAAARLNLLSLPEIAARLDRRFSLLTDGSRTALPRHQTLRAAIEWSYDLLSTAEQGLFRRLSIFAGGFTLEAAEAVCANEEIPNDEILTLLGRLVRKSLLNVVTARQDTELPTRYRFLETIRSFGRLKLDGTEETRWIQDRCAGYYVRLVESAEPELLLPNQAHWSRLLQAENDNLRAVIEWSAESGGSEKSLEKDSRTADNPVESALRLVGALLWFWFSYGSTREGRDLALKALAAPTGAPFLEARARALNTAGFLLYLLGDTASARQALEEARSIQLNLGEKANLAWSLQFLGMVLAYDQEYDQADAAFREGLALTRKIDGVYSNNFLHFLGDIDMLKGNYPRARKIYEESVDILRAIGSQSFLAYPLRRLGYLALGEHNISGAWQYFQESLAINVDIGDQRAIAACLTSISALAMRLDKPVMAARLYGNVESRLETLATNLLNLDQIELTRIYHHLRSRIDQAVFTTADNDGWTMSEEESIALAREIILPVSQ